MRGGMRVVFGAEDAGGGESVLTFLADPQWRETEQLLEHPQFESMFDRIREGLRRVCGSTRSRAPVACLCAYRTGDDGTTTLRRYFIILVWRRTRCAAPSPRPGAK